MEYVTTVVMNSAKLASIFLHSKNQSAPAIHPAVKPMLESGSSLVVASTAPRTGATVNKDLTITYTICPVCGYDRSVVNVESKIAKHREKMVDKTTLGAWCKGSGEKPNGPTWEE
jgi:hypothetical protein